MSTTTLDLAHIDLMAGAASAWIRDTGWTAVIITPGDMTRYHLVITPNEALRENTDGDVTCDVMQRGWVVTTTSPDTTAWPWTGDEVDPHYAAEHWGDDRLHTGTVVAAFLNALAGYLDEQ